MTPGFFKAARENALVNLIVRYGFESIKTTLERISKDERWLKEIERRKADLVKPE